MKLTFVNVGYGEAILLECPDPAYENGVFVMLIDGGSARAEEFADAASGRIPLAEYLRTNGPGHIDVMVNSHPHEDHICGLLPVAECVTPSALWQMLPVELAEQMRPLDVDSARTSSERLFMQALNAHKTLCTSLVQKGCAVSALHAGDAGTLCEGLTYRVLAPSEEQIEKLDEKFRKLYAQEGEAFFKTLNELDGCMNNRSLVLLLEYQGTRLLLPGDTNAVGYGGIDPEALSAHLFKVGHHGQKDGIDQPLLDVMNPKAVVCCASSDRRYNSAHPDVVEMLRRNDIELYFSDCPELPGLELPPHRALTFTVDAGGALSAEYIS